MTAVLSGWMDVDLEVVCSWFLGFTYLISVTRSHVDDDCS